MTDITNNSTQIQKIDNKLERVLANQIRLEGFLAAIVRDYRQIAKDDGDDVAMRFPKVGVGNCWNAERDRQARAEMAANNIQTNYS